MGRHSRPCPVSGASFEELSVISVSGDMGEAVAVEDQVNVNG
jgi:hypothetical protein